MRGRAVSVAYYTYRGTGEDTLTGGKGSTRIEAETCHGEPPAGFGCLDCGTEGERP
jgi:hypothetical protein